MEHDREGIWSDFRKTVFRCDVPAKGFPSRFAIVTAFNAEGRPRTDDENLRQDADLLKQLEELNLDHFPIRAGSLDGSHVEPSHGISMRDSRLGVELGRRFRQLAIFWVEEGELYLIRCDTESRERLGTWEERRAKLPEKESSS